MPKTPAARTPAPATRSVTVPAPADLELAKDDALLQLRIGRMVHLYAVLVSGALAVVAIILLLFYPTLPTLRASETGGPALVDSFFVLVPIAAGLAIAAIGLISKWEAFQLWPWEPHFSTTVGALLANVAIAAIYGLRIAGVSPFDSISLYPWLVPAALGGISVAFLGIALTWSGWSRQQWASAISAVLPVATSLLLFFHPSGTNGESAALAVTLLLSAILYQTSGSFLHLLSSGTRPHERELITSGQSRMFRLADEVRQKEQAIQFREAALVKREADVENSEQSIRRQNDALAEARQQLDDIEEEYQTRSDALVAKEREWAGRIAEMDGRSKLVDDRTKAVELREQEVSRQFAQHSSREQRLVEGEGALTKREVEVAHRERAVQLREGSLSESAARLAARTKEVDDRMADLLRREAGVTAQGARPTTPAPGIPTSLAEREARLSQLKAVLDEQNASLGRKSREAAESARTVADAMRSLVQKESELGAREVALRQQEGRLAELLKAADERKTRYDAAQKDYEARLTEAKQQAVEAAQKNTDLGRSLKSAQDRTTTLDAREARLKAALADLAQHERDLTARERALEATEAEVSLRRQEVERSGDLTLAGLAAVAAADRMSAPPARPTLRSTSGSGIRDVSTVPQETGSPTLTPSVGRRYSDRLPSGTPRLDDLLLGGLPPKAHVVLLGEAFVGKEIVLYSFIAEGLKRGEPAVLLTASRSPNEVAASMGVVLPQFLEYEQMGMVTWIDASGSGTTPGDHRIVVKGSDDRVGILSNLVKVAKGIEDARRGPFRVGFLGLSAVLAHGDERAGFSFLQNAVGILKPRDALAVYSLEGAALSEAQVTTLLSRMDGAIVFRQDRDRTFLSVQGFGDVETRDWVECRATNRALVVGSFALQRIR
ncbi:MAG TPA: ATPase domain-containing protein [Thermoplasmata archaeon]|nr:ATPase domain-containing protein [Thermoplasmata archaeon]